MYENFERWVRPEIESILVELGIEYDEIRASEEDGGEPFIVVKLKRVKQGDSRSIPLHFSDSNMEDIDNGNNEHLKPILGKMLKNCMEDWKNNGLEHYYHFKVSHEGFVRGQD